MGNNISTVQQQMTMNTMANRNLIRATINQPWLATEATKAA